MIGGPFASIPSTREPFLFGAGFVTSEVNAQASATEGATFSRLTYSITSGGSLVNNMRFRKNGEDGNMLATRSGTGIAVDEVNTDVRVANDLFNLAATDTGTDPANIPFISANVEFASGHGNFHGSCTPSGAGNIYDVGSATRYISLSGLVLIDGTATVANAQWKNRGYTSVEAIQVRIPANARVNDSTFRLNVNGTDVGTAITVGAGITALFTVTEMGQALADGDLVCISVTLGAGVEDLTVSLVAATFKSTSGKSESWAQDFTGLVRAASATANYIPPGGDLTTSPVFTEAQARVKVGFACRIKNLRTHLSANTCTGDQTIKVFVNGVEALTVTIAASATAWQENTADGVIIGADDEVSLEVLGGSSGSATFTAMGVTFDPLSSFIHRKTFPHIVLQ